MAASLDSSYVLAPSLQDYFVSKTTGLPLTNGTVYFYKDQARTVPKPVFELVSAAPGGPYTYNPLPNPIVLSAVGTIVDGSGVDVIPYYHPYDASGNIELYYIVVYDANGVLQFTREAWPNLTAETITNNRDVTNFVANGQFLAHNNVPASSANSYVAGQISQAVTQIAPGGWTFERDVGSSATDLITFPEYLSSPQIPTGNPRYALQVQTTVAGSDTRKDICLKFPGVNTFAGNADNLAYNFYFEGQAISANISAEVYIIKFFGTGGSPTATITTPVQPITFIAGQINKYNVLINFGINTNATLGTNNDDYVQIVIRLPPTGTGTVQVTDFALTVTEETLTAFPPQTSAQQLDETLAGYIPNPDPNGFNLYLPVLAGPTGFIYDASRVGSFITTLSTTTNANTLLYPTLPMDGSTYRFQDYSSLGIPYARLGNFFVNNSAIANTPMGGTGPNFVTIYTVSGQPTEFLLIINGGTPAVAPNAGTSGFSISGSAAAYTYTITSPPAASTYFYFQTTEGSPRNFYVWFNVNNSTPPVVTGTLLPVVLNGTETSAQVVTKILIAVNQYQFMIPNITGLFLRALDTSGIYDLDYASRTIAALKPAGSTLTGANLGSLEVAAFLNHTHTNTFQVNGSHNTVGGNAPIMNGNTFDVTASGALSGSVGTSPTGGDETRPVNFAVNFFIYY